MISRPGKSEAKIRVFLISLIFEIYYGSAECFRTISHTPAEFILQSGRGAIMSDRKSWLAVVVGVGLVLNGCAWMSNRTRTENALIAAAACGIPAAVAGGLVANNNDANTHMRVPAGAAAGLFGGALICGG